jgi:hypothetical protein
MIFNHDLPSMTTVEPRGAKLRHGCPRRSALNCARTRSATVQNSPIPKGGGKSSTELSAAAPFSFTPMDTSAGEAERVPTSLRALTDAPDGILGRA